MGSWNWFLYFCDIPEFSATLVSVDKTSSLVFMKEEIFNCTLKIPSFQLIDLLVLSSAMMYGYEILFWTTLEKSQMCCSWLVVNVVNETLQTCLQKEDWKTFLVRFKIDRKDYLAVKLVSAVQRKSCLVWYKKGNISWKQKTLLRWLLTIILIFVALPGNSHY